MSQQIAPSKVIVTNLLIEQWFDQLPEKIDLWITDPPYPFDNQNGSGRFDYKDGTDEMYSRMEWTDLEKVFQQMYDFSNNGARAYVFANRDGLAKTQTLLESAGWTFRNLIPWDKVRWGGGYHWRNVFEYILYVSKGKPKVLVKNAPNKFTYPKPTKKDSVPAIGYNPTGTSPKPHQIWHDIITYGGHAEDVCADPFAGSNPMKAALELDANLMAKIKSAHTNSLDI
jgi:DNA modification methylase